MTSLLVIVAALLGLALGYFSREVHEYLKRIELALKVLLQRKQRQDIEEAAKKPGMSFGDTMTMAELEAMDEEERIAAVNASM